MDYVNAGGVAFQTASGKFKVNNDGSVYATDGTFSGTITVTGGNAATTDYADQAEADAIAAAEEYADSATTVTNYTLYQNANLTANQEYIIPFKYNTAATATCVKILEFVNGSTHKAFNFSGTLWHGSASRYQYSTTFDINFTASNPSSNVTSLFYTYGDSQSKLVVRYQIVGTVLTVKVYINLSTHSGVVIDGLVHANYAGTGSKCTCWQTGSTEALSMTNLAAVHNRYNEDAATAQGFADYDAMVAAYTALGSTIISGGYINTGLVEADSISVTNLSSISANMGSLTAGTITLNSTGFIKGGATGYNTGTGFFLGYSSGYKVSIGNGSTKYLLWDGSNLSWAGTNTSLTAAGVFTATNGIFSGRVEGSTFVGTGGTILISDSNSSYSADGFFMANTDIESPSVDDLKFGIAQYNSTTYTIGYYKYTTLWARAEPNISFSYASSGMTLNAGYINIRANPIELQSDTHIIYFQDSTFAPALNNTVSVGTSSKKFNEVHATTINATTGNITTVASTTVGATTGNITTVNATTLSLGTYSKLTDGATTFGTVKANTYKASYTGFTCDNGITLMGSGNATNYYGGLYSEKTNTAGNAYWILQHRNRLHTKLYNGEGAERIQLTTNTTVFSGSASDGLNIYSSGATVGAKWWANGGTAMGYVWGVNGSYFAWGRGSTSNSLFLSTAANRLGIFTATPSYALHLNSADAAKTSGTTWISISDERTKENISFANLDRCYEIVKTLPLKRYTYKKEILSDSQAPDRSKLGWIAQDVQKVFPKAVSVSDMQTQNIVDYVTNHNGEQEPVYEVLKDYLHLDSDQLFIVTYGAVQKLMEKIEYLETVLSAMDSTAETITKE